MEGFWTAVVAFMGPGEAFWGPVEFEWRAIVQREERGAVVTVGTVSLEGVGGKEGALADGIASATEDTAHEEEMTHEEEVVDEDEQGVGGE